MVGIIVVFPNKGNAANIRNLLVRGGMDVTGACTTGAQALNYADALDEGIVVCGYKLKDMMYTELREYLPEQFEMLLIASADKWSTGMINGIVGLSMPVKAYDLMNTMDMMLRNIGQRRRKLQAGTKNQRPQAAGSDQAGERTANGCATTCRRKRPTDICKRAVWTAGRIW